MRRILFSIFLFCLVLFPVSSVIDLDDFNIHAVIPGEGSEETYGEIVILNIYEGAATVNGADASGRLIISGDDINLGRGTRLFSTEGAELFSVEYTSNDADLNLDLDVEVSPFTYSYSSVDGTTSTSVLPMKLIQESGYSFTHSDDEYSASSNPNGIKVSMSENSSSVLGTKEIAKTGEIYLAGWNLVLESQGTTGPRHDDWKMTAWARYTVSDLKTTSNEGSFVPGDYKMTVKVSVVVD